MALIQVKYSCEKCGIKRVEVSVVPRSPRENIIDFVKRAASQCKADHDTRSPDCEIVAFSEVMIPIEKDGDAPIGSVPTAH